MKTQDWFFAPELKTRVKDGFEEMERRVCCGSRF